LFLPPEEIGSAGRWDLPDGGVAVAPCSLVRAGKDDAFHLVFLTDDGKKRFGYGGRKAYFRWIESVLSVD
jgi:hypothetical protein